MLKISKLISLQWSPYHFISGPKNVFMVNHSRPRLYMRVRWNLNFIRECMKINKIRSKLYLLENKFTIKMTQLVFVLCVLRSVRFWSHLKAVLSCFTFRVVLKNFNELPCSLGSLWFNLLQLSRVSIVVSGICQIWKIRDWKYAGDEGVKPPSGFRDEGIEKHYWGTSIEWDRNNRRRAIKKSQINLH